MKAAATLFVFAVLVAAVFANEYEFPCPQKERPAGQNDCSYYCQLGGEWKLGKYQSGISCDYNAKDDGVCKDGLCHSKESVSSGSGDDDRK